MARFRLDAIAQLARQMEFASPSVRAAQVAAAEGLLHSLDSNKAYPTEFIIFRITGYRPRGAQAELLTGVALQHDLGALIERISNTLNIKTSTLSEPVLDIDDVCEKFNVTSKTIQRWRRKGLAARKFIFPDGKRRVGFLLGSVERFVAGHGDQVVAAANFSQVDEEERQEILRRARRLSEGGQSCASEISGRVARMIGRSRLTVLHIVRKHDREHPEQAIFTRAGQPMGEQDREMIFEACRRGERLGELARRTGRARNAIYRIIMECRANRLMKRLVRFQDDPLYHQDDAAAVIQSIISQEELGDRPAREDFRLPRDLPAYFQELYRTPLLSRSRERAMFLKLNFHKFRFVEARGQLEPERPRHRELSVLESHLAAAEATKNQIVRANLRLVVSVARKHVRAGAGLLELVSDGNLTLMRAVDGFDIHRGNRFSTYATLALMKGFARSVPRMLVQRSQTSGGEQMLAEVPDARPVVTRFVERDEVRHLLSRLDERERSIVSAHFGLGSRTEAATYEQVGERLGISKERVRQIEHLALAKLRATAEMDAE